MSVRFSKERGWIVDWYWPDGMRTRKPVPDESTAKKIHMKIEVACADEDRIWRKLRRELRLEGGILQGLSSLADIYLENWVTVHNRSVRSKRSRLEILKRHFGSLPIDAMNAQAVDGFVSARRKAKIGNRTINRDLAVLRHLYGWAVNRGYLELNPIARVEKLEEIQWVGERPDDAVLDRIFDKLHPTVRPAFVFLRETGCRREEAITLKRGQVDFARAQVVFHSNTKNGKYRQVPLTEAALCAITAMPRHGDTVFYHPGTLKPWTGDTLASQWEKAREAVESGIRIHDLRHAYGIGLAESGCPMHFISEVMGHHSVDFTRKHYARFSPESASKAVLKVLEGRKTASGHSRGV